MKATSQSYNDPVKHRWQRIANITSWDRMIKKPVSLRRVVYLDTREAIQTMALLDHGYRPENLLACNYAPVELALLTQKLDRNGYLRVLTKSGDFLMAGYGLGHIDIVDFDGMSNITGDVGEVGLTNLVLTNTPKVLSFTILCGRESKHYMEHIKFFSNPSVKHDSNGHKINPNHWARMLFCLKNATRFVPPSEEHPSTCLAHVIDLYWGVYISNKKQPMAWMSAALDYHKRSTNSTALLKKAPLWLKKMATMGVVPHCIMAMGDKQPVEGIDWFPGWSSDQYCALEQPPKDTSKYIGWPTRDN